MLGEYPLSGGPISATPTEPTIPPLPDGKQNTDSLSGVSGDYTRTRRAVAPPWHDLNLGSPSTIAYVAEGIPPGRVLVDSFQGSARHFTRNLKAVHQTHISTFIYDYYNPPEGLRGVHTLDTLAWRERQTSRSRLSAGHRDLFDSIMWYAPPPVPAVPATAGTRILWGPGSHITSQQLTGPSGNFIILNDALDEFAILFQAPKSGTLESFTVQVSSKAGSDRTWKGGFFTVDGTTGYPTGTLYASSTEASVSITGSGLFTLIPSTGAVVSQGDFLCLRFYDDGTAFGGSDSVTINLGRSDFSLGDCGFPLELESTDGGTTWSKLEYYPVVAVKYSDGSYIFATATNSQSLGTSTTHNTSTTPDEYGGKFLAPWRMQVIGMRAQINLTGAYTDFVCRLYDTDGTTVLASATFNTNEVVNNVSTARNFWIHWSPVYIEAGSYYYVSVQSVGTTSIRGPVNLKVDDPDQRGAFPYSDGLNWSFVTRTDGGSWSEDTSGVPAIALAVSGVST